MSIDYRLTLAGSTPVEVVAARAFAEAGERPTGTAGRLSAALYERYGFAVTVHAGKDGYLDAMSDAGPWEWEPEHYVAIIFSLDKAADREWAVTNVGTVVHRILDTGAEDAALDLNGDILLLVRIDGAVVKHHRDAWWSHHPAADQLLR